MHWPVPVPQCCEKQLGFTWSPTYSVSWERSQFAGSGRKTQLLECCPLCSWKPASHFSSEPLWSSAGTGLDQNYLFSAGCLQFSLQEASPGGQEGTLPWLESQLEFPGPYFVGSDITSAYNHSELTLKQLTKAP